jgi:ADP-heptose:LPS heptosyltransferase
MARAIKLAIPDAHVGFYCRDYTRPLVERCPDVDEVVIRKSTPSLLSDTEAFRSGNWDTIFFPNARFELALAAWLARVPVRIGTAYRFYAPLFNRRIHDHRKTAEHHEAEYNLRMLQAIGLHADPNLLPAIVLHFDEIERVERWKREHGLSRKYAILHTLSGGSSHNWPRENWLSLARGLSDMNIETVLSGTEPERQELERMQVELSAAGITAYSFIGHSLPELAAIVASASLVVSGSTGPGHLAAALGTRSVGIFPLPRPLSKERWGFRGRNVTNLSPVKLPSCPDCVECNCMQRLAVSDVLTAINLSGALGEGKALGEGTVIKA